MSARGKKARVKKQKLCDVVGTNKWRVNNFMDKDSKPFPVREIVKGAIALVDREFDYNLFYRNCEHLGTYLRYGTPESRQVSEQTFLKSNTKQKHKM